MVSCGVVARVVSVVITTIVSVYLGPEKSLAVFVTPILSPWQHGGVFDFTPPYWRAHRVVPTLGLHLPFPPNDTPPVPNIPFATPYPEFGVGERAVVSFLNGKVVPAPGPTIPVAEPRLPEAGWKLPTAAVAASFMLKVYWHLGVYALYIFVVLLVLGFAHKLSASTSTAAPAYPTKASNRPPLFPAPILALSGISTNVEFPPSHPSTPAPPISAPVIPTVASNRPPLSPAPILALSGISTNVEFPSSHPPTTAPLTSAPIIPNTVDSSTQTELPGFRFKRSASVSADPTSVFTPLPSLPRPTSSTMADSGTQTSPSSSPPASLSSTLTYPSSGAEPRPPPSPAPRPAYNPDASNFIPHMGNQHPIPPPAGRGGPVPGYGGPGGPGAAPFGLGFGGFPVPGGAGFGAPGVPPYGGHGGFRPAGVPNIGGRGGGFPGPGGPPHGAGGVPPPWNDEQMAVWQQRFQNHGRRL